MSGQFHRAAGASGTPVAPHQSSLLRPPHPPPPPPVAPQLASPAAPLASAEYMSAPAAPDAPPAGAPAVPCPPDESEADVLPPYPEEDFVLPEDPHQSLSQRVSSLPVPAPLQPAAHEDQIPEAVYHSTAQLQKQQQQQQQQQQTELSALQADEGVRRLQSKYASPGSLMPQPPLPPDMASDSLAQGEGAVGVAPPKAHPQAADVTTPMMSLAEGLTENDIMQVEMFYRSHKTEVHVCRCLANLYFSSKEASREMPDWEFAHTGVPLLLLDSGDHIRQRKLAIILAEKGTGFTLWKDPIDHLTKYSAPHGNFHTLHLSKDHQRLVGLSFDDQAAAAEFYSTISTLTSNPDDVLLNLSKSKKEKKEEKKKKKKEKYKPPKKTDISQPCCFMQITKLERPTLGPPSVADQTFMDSMNNLQLSDTASSQGSLHNL